MRGPLEDLSYGPVTSGLETVVGLFFLVLIIAWIWNKGNLLG